MRKFIITLLAYAGCIAVCTSSAAISQDTYVNSLTNSHQTDFDDNGGGYQYNPPPNNNYLPPPSSPPPPVYGPPDHSYLPPPQPAPVYGPPAPPPFPVYGPPPPYFKPSEPLPYHAHDSWFLTKLKSKINLFTIGKIILKLLIFKKIVKFIGLICLLLVLPKLKHMFKEDTSMEEDAMETKHVETDREKLEKKIEELYDFITESISYFDK